MPTCSRRQCASEFSFILRSSSPAKRMRPPLGRSIPVNILRRVDLPLPEGPFMAKRLCAGTVNVISSKMVVFCARVSITRERDSTWISGRPYFRIDWFWSIDNFDISFPPDTHRNFAFDREHSYVACYRWSMPARYMENVSNLYQNT